MVKLFLFDLGKVLVDFDFQIAIKRLEVFCPIDPKKVLALFRDSRFSENWDKGLISSAEFFETVKKELGLPINMSQFAEIWNEIFTEKREMIRFAQSLKADYKVSVISNTNPWHAFYVREQFPWMRAWDDFIASCEVHLLKPDPEIFKLALNRAKASPAETVYVDDIFENVEAARKMGMDALLFKNSSELFGKIKSKGIQSLALLEKSSSSIEAAQE